MTEPDPRREFLLSSLRVASLNLKSWANEIDQIGIGLRSDHISMETALTWLDEMGVLYWLPDKAEQDAAE